MGIENTETYRQETLPFEGRVGNRFLAEETLRKSPELSTLYAVTSILNSSRDLNALLEGSLEQIVDKLDFDSGAIFLHAPGINPALELKHWKNLDDSVAELLKTNPPCAESSFSWQRAMHGKPSNCDEGGSPWPLLEGSGHRVCCLYPLNHAENPIGVLALFRQDGRSCRPTIRTLAELAYQIGIAVEKAQLFEVTKRQAHDMEGLYRASIDLNDCFDSRSAAKEALAHAVHLSGARCGAISLLSKQGSLELACAFPPSLISEDSKAEGAPSSTNEVLHTYKPLVLNDLTHQSVDFTFWSWLPSTGNYCGVPLTSRNKIVGVLELAGKGCDFSAGDTKLIETLARQTAVSIENTRFLEEKSNIADILQRALLPSTPLISGLDIGSVYASATAMAAVGGDFYDFLELDENKLVVICGDVCGKGIEAAATTAMVRYLLRSLVNSRTSPASIVFKLNKALSTQLSSSEFVTIFLAMYDRATGELHYINCGHPPAILHKKDGEPELLESTDIPLGLFPAYRFHRHKTVLEPGDFLVLYTDGVLEARYLGEFFGQDRLVETVRKHGRDHKATAIARSVYLACSRFAHGDLNDDIAIVTLRREP